MDDVLLATYDVVYGFLRYNGWATGWHLHNYCYLLILDGIIEDVWRDWDISLGFGVYSWKFEYMLYKLLGAGFLRTSCVSGEVSLCGVYVLPKYPVKPRVLIISRYIGCSRNLIELVYGKSEMYFGLAVS